MLRILLIDANTRYVNPTRNLVPSLLGQIGELVCFGPGYSSQEELKKGLNAFISKNGEFDLYIATEIGLFRDDWSDFYQSAIIKYSANDFHPEDLRYFVPIMKDFNALSAVKVISLLQTDFYAWTDFHIDRIDNRGYHFIAPSGSLFKWRSEMQNLENETFADLVNDNWKRFSEKNKDKIIPFTHFVSEAELYFECLSNRKKRWSVQGANYAARIVAREELSKAGYNLKEWSPTSIYEKFRKFLGNQRAEGLFVQNYIFNRRLETVKYSFTCNSAMEFPLRKMFEIPAKGCVLVMPETKTAKALGYVHMENCIFTEPSEIRKIDYWLSTNEDKAQSIARNGLELIMRSHTISARAKMLSEIFDQLVQSQYKGADWMNGELVL
ncbi:glycosyltransferase family protein [Curvivirga sp.]|uniref:glycosyltransferase n=1 Tax=Curvivirga sp. TaxID=2856848 RepID=UPI003B5A0258